MHRVAYALSVLLFLFSPSLLAQTPDTTTADTFRVELPEVTVKGARSSATEASAPFSVTVKSRSPDDLSYSPNTSLDDVLRSVPGIWVNDRHHFALGERISVRGVGYRSNFGVRGLQVLYDGIPLTLPDGQAFLDVVDPAVVRRAELVRSPASTFWGNGGGGVLFLSSEPTSAPPLRARVQGGSYGRWQGLLEGSGSVGQWDLHAYGSGNRQEGFRDHSTGVRIRGGVNAVREFGPNTTLRLTAAGDVQDTENPSGISRRAFRDDPTQADSAFAAVDAGKQSSQVQLGATLDHDFGKTTVSGTVYGLRRDLDNPLSFAFIRFTRWNGGVRFTVRRTTGRVEGGVGVDAAVQRDDRVNFQTTENGDPAGPLTLDQVETVTSGSSFGYLRWNLTDRLALTGATRFDGIRFDADDDLVLTDIEAAAGDQSGNRTFTSLSPSVGLSYNVGTSLLFARFSTAFETPTTTELVNRPSGEGGFNEALDPQRTNGVEIGARGSWPAARLSYDVALFRQIVDDQIQQVGQTPQGRDFFGNVARSWHDGVELSLTWSPVRSAEVKARYMGNRFRFEEADDESVEGNRLPGIPSHRGYLHVEGDVRGWWGRIAGEAVPDYPVNDANTEDAPGYVNIDLRFGPRELQWRGAALKPFLGVDNLLDERYAGSVVINAFGGEFFEPAPDRSFSLGLNVTW